MLHYRTHGFPAHGILNVEVATKFHFNLRETSPNYTPVLENDEFLNEYHILFC